MKSIKKYVLCMLAGVSICSCDYLDVVPDNVATIDYAFTDRFAAEKFLATCYWTLPKSASWNENPGFFGTLDLLYNSNFRNERGIQIGLGNDNVTSPINPYWNSTNYYTRSLFAGIRDCNTFLENIDNVKDLNQMERNRMTAEVKVIKAYLHFFMVIYYGPIPTLRVNISPGEDTKTVRTYREKIDECFAYVLELLDEVIQSKALPDMISNRSSELGRFTNATAHAIKAKVSVYRASDLFNGNTEYNTFLDHKGEPFFNQKYEPARWDSAASACLKAIEICGDNFRLYQTSDYHPVVSQGDTTLIINTLRSAVSERWNPEIIWGNSSYKITGNSASGDVQGLSLAPLEPYQGGPWEIGRMSVALHVAELFYSRNGVPIEEDTEWASNKYADRYLTRTGDRANRFYIQEGEVTAGLNFDREARFYATLGFDRGKWYGNHYDNTPEDDSRCRYLRARYREYSAPFTRSEMYNATGYFPKKLVSVNTLFRDQMTLKFEDFPFPDFRYADLLLLTAEALNESKGAPDAEVYQYIDMVRERAGLKGVVESWANYSNNPDKPKSKEGMREIIRRERQIELACEGHNYFDYRRWKIAPAKLNNRPVQGWNVQYLNVDEYYTIHTEYVQKFAFKDYFAPIPENEIIRSPQLIQNPGW